MRTTKTSAAPAAKTKKGPRAKPAATPPAPEAADIPKPAKLSALGAARVLAETGKALNCRQLIEAMAAQGYWTSPGGRTPEAIRAKGPKARFRKVERGQFAANIPA